MLFKIQDANSEVWISTDSESDEAEPATEQNHGMSQHLRLIYTFLLFWQFAYKVSNNAMHCLLRFLKYIILLIGNAFQCHQISDSAQQFPVTLNSLYKQMLVENNHLFTEYVVCRKCHSVYEYDNCIIRRSNGRSESKRCSHVAYPRHPHRTQRQPCNEILLKRIRTGKGYKLIPFKVYPYYTLEKQFARLLKRKNFTTKCEMWRRRANFIHEDNLSDVYDGRVWKKFNSADGLNFLTSPYSYLLTLNVDWFQPFDRGVYSVGALYITVQNLPRSERFKSENVLLIGIIPGPKEPKHAINSYLAPLVLELQKAWESGFLMKTAQQVEVRVKLALSCVSCDIPASRKVVGFLGHNATLGCNKCYKNFYVRVGEESDFSGYDRDNWTLRDEKRHRGDVDTVREQVTKSGIKAKQSELGVRYSVLLELEYFDPIEFTVIDVMHNLFLGSAKRVLEIWIEKGIIKKDNLVKIDGMIQSFNMPTDCGRIPSNLSSSHGAFTASQWKNWIITYSPVVLKNILPRDHLGCWLLFVRACVLISKRFINKSEVRSADILLLNFCRRFESLYGKEACTPNMHLHLHLKDTLMNFGPSHAFWCFPFERYNGLLGSYHTNRKSIETQVMKRFCLEQAVHSMDLPMENMFLQLLPANSNDEDTIPTIDINTSLRALSLSVEQLDDISSFVLDKSVSPLPPYTEQILDAEYVELLSTLYSELYPDKMFSQILPCVQRYGRVTLFNEIIGSCLRGRNNKKSSVIMAYWPSSGATLRGNRHTGL